MLQKLSVDQMDVLKMDVQGAEELVLLGASRIIQSRRPLIIFEVYPERGQYAWPLRIWGLGVPRESGI